MLFHDEQPLLESLKNILYAAGYDVIEAADSDQATQILEREQIDVLVTDTHLNGAENTGMLNFVGDDGYGIDVIILTSHPELELVRRLIDAGVYDLITKPFHSYELLLSINRAIEKRKLMARSRELQLDMEKKIKEKTLSLRLRNQEKQQLLISTIRSLVSALEAKDKYTEGHSRRVADNASLVAQTLGFTSFDIEEIHLAGLFHDIGKIGIAESVLNKKGQLSPDEYNLIKTHPLISQKIVEQVPQFKRISRIIRHHHEFFDGNGYPDGLQGQQIPIGARIMTICDAYDAMTSDRSYRPALSDSRALGIIERNAGTQFDPDLVKIFLRMKGAGN